MLKIVTAPDPVLSKSAETIKKVDSTVLGLIEQMKETLDSTHDPEGVGLAAPQVGKSVRLFIAKPTPKSPHLIFINPSILKMQQRLGMHTRKRNVKGKSQKLEGCLSLPSIWGPVLRSPTLTLFYLDEKGIQHSKSFSGFLATIIQHEIDHLDGILFPKRVLEQQGKLYKSSKDKKGEDVFEELEI